MGGIGLIHDFENTGADVGMKALAGKVMAPPLALVSAHVCVKRLSVPGFRPSRVTIASCVMVPVCWRPAPNPSARSVVQCPAPLLRVNAHGSKESQCLRDSRGACLGLWGCFNSQRETAGTGQLATLSVLTSRPRVEATLPLETVERPRATSFCLLGVFRRGTTCCMFWRGRKSRAN